LYLYIFYNFFKDEVEVVALEYKHDNCGMNKRNYTKISNMILDT